VVSGIFTHVDWVVCGVATHDGQMPPALFVIQFHRSLKTQRLPLGTTAEKADAPGTGVFARTDMKVETPLNPINMS
jgi:hypothetical protein